MVVMLAAAVVLSIVAGVQTYRLWRNLPGVRVGRLYRKGGAEREGYLQEMRQANAKMSAEAREALGAAELSGAFTAALFDERVLAVNRDLVQSRLSTLVHTEIGRLQLAAMFMLEMERAGKPPEQWWPTLVPLLSGYSRACYAHYLQRLIDNRREVFRKVGLPPGTARVEALRYVGHPHGPMLEFLVSRLRRVADARRDNDPESAAVCQQVSRRLLKEWVLESGPLGLRLLAADLLARELEIAATSAPADQTALAKRLREWRAAYHAGADTRPVPAIPLSYREGPELFPADYDRLAGRVTRTLWAAGSTIAAAVLTVLALAVGVSTGAKWPAWGWLEPMGAVLAIAVIAALVLVHALAPGTVADDLRRLGSGETGWPRTPFVAAGLVLVVMALTWLWPTRAESPLGARSMRTARVATTAWLALCVFLMVFAARTGVALRDYEELTGDVTPAEEYSIIAGTDDGEFLEALRAWTP